MEPTTETKKEDFKSSMTGFTKTPKKTTTKKTTASKKATATTPKEFAAQLTNPYASEEEEVPLTYLERIKEFGLKTEDAIAIVDKLISEDKYTEKVKLSSSLDVTFSTRDVRFSHYVTEKLDSLARNEIGMYSQLSSEYQLAGSMESYGKEKMPSLGDSLSDEEWERNLLARIKFIKALPNPAFLALVRKLAMFDMKMTTVMSEGYDENF